MTTARPKPSPAKAQATVDDARVPEAIEAHTTLLRLALGIEESRAYCWENVDPIVPAAARAPIAFEQRWFGSKSLDRPGLLGGGDPVTQPAFQQGELPADRDYRPRTYP